MILRCGFAEITAFGKMQKNIKIVKFHKSAVGFFAVFFIILEFRRNLAIFIKFRKKIYFLAETKCFEAFRKNEPFNFDCIRQNAQTQEYSHDNFFHTVISMTDMNMKLSAYDKNLDILAGCRKA